MMISRIFTTQCEDTRVQMSIAQISSDGGIDVYRVRIVMPEKMQPPPVTISWEEDMTGLLHVWHPLYGAGRMHQWFAPTTSHSNFCFGAPVLTTIGAQGQNAEAIAVSDVITPISISFCVKDLDQQDKVGYAVTFFYTAADALSEYEADIRIDTRKIPYDEAIQSVYPWWSEYGYQLKAVPAAAEDALYSTWYNFHQAPNGEKILADLKIAAALGFRTVILDDGWQFAGPSSGDYALCGAWEVSPDKFADFKAFADGVHALGMKLMVWFAVPFIGVDSPLFETFRGKYLYVDYGIMNEGTLDPRYPEVRAYILSNYKRFLQEYDIDGFKLDFVDSFCARDETAPYDPAVMDCETVGDAVRRLMEEITAELDKIKSGLLYEYRQNYIGPAINRFGNMLRVCDCAYDAQSNRAGIVNLRLLNYPTAIHADMLLWSPEESVTMCARQLLNILYGVPQISVILADSTEEQRALVGAYLDYWTEHREILLHGVFHALHPEQNYPYISAQSEEKEIVVLHSELCYTYHGKSCDVHNNTENDSILFENPINAEIHAEILDRFGAVRITDVTAAPHSISRIPVPMTGMLRVNS